MRTKKLVLFLAAAPLGVCFVLGTAAAGLPQERAAPGSSPAAQVLLQVKGEVSTPLKLSQADLLALPRQAVSARAHDGKDSRYEGVALSEVLKKAGLPNGKDLRGKAVALYLVVEAADGYRAVFSLAEIDPEFTDRVVLLADHRDGKPLSAREGPIQIVVPGEKRHARWVRQVVALRIGRA